MRVLVTGGRNFGDIGLVENALSELHATKTISVLIHGAAKGADALVCEWAKQNSINVLSCPADWKRFGRGAGTRRNRDMLTHKPDLVIAFPGGRGTGHMTELAEK